MRRVSSAARAASSGSVVLVPSARFLRVLRYVGIAILVTAPITSTVLWFQGQKVMALGLLGAKLYVGLFAVWGLPWLLRRATRQTRDAS